MYWSQKVKVDSGEDMIFFPKVVYLKNNQKSLVVPTPHMTTV